MIRHIAAIDQRFGIAKNGVQPWKLPADERYFGDITKQFGGIILMGRTTFEVIGHPLPGRDNYVLTHSRAYRAEGVHVVHDLRAFLAEQPDVWIIGGAELYKETLMYSEELYITHIAADFDCDTFYPEFTDEFELISREPALEDQGISFYYAKYKTKRL